VLAKNPGTLPLTARFKKFFAQRTLAERTQTLKQIIEIDYNTTFFEALFFSIRWSRL
jgi:hypothetical protein